MLIQKYKIQVPLRGGSNKDIPLDTNLAYDTTAGNEAREEFGYQVRTSQFDMRKLDLEGNTLWMNFAVSQLDGELHMTLAHLRVPLFRLDTKPRKDMARVKVERPNWHRTDPDNWERLFNQLQRDGNWDSPPEIKLHAHGAGWSEYRLADKNWCKWIHPKINARGYITWRIIPEPAAGSDAHKLWTSERDEAWSSLVKLDPAYKNIRYYIGRFQQIHPAKLASVKLFGGILTITVGEFQKQMEHLTHQSHPQWMIKAWEYAASELLDSWE